MRMWATVMVRVLELMLWLLYMRLTNVMLPEVLSRNAFADKWMRGSETTNNFAQSSSDVLAGKIDGVERTTNGTDEEILSTGR